MYVWSRKPGHAAHIVEDKTGLTLCSIESNERLSSKYPLTNFGNILPFKKEVCGICLRSARVLTDKQSKVLKEDKTTYNEVYGNKKEIPNKRYVPRLNKYVYYK